MLSILDIVLVLICVIAVLVMSYCARCWFFNNFSPYVKSHSDILPGYLRRSQNLQLFEGFIYILLLCAFFYQLLLGVLVSCTIVACGYSGYRFLVRKRSEMFLSQLPDFLIAVCSSMRSGMSINKSIQASCDNSYAPMSTELNLVLMKYKLGENLPHAILRIKERVPLQDIDLLSSAINVSLDVGGNLADTLETIADVVRRKYQMEAKIEALTAMGKTQSWVVSGCPLLIGLYLYWLDPEVMLKLFTTGYGLVLLTAMLLMLICGVVFIRKICNIDI